MDLSDLWIGDRLKIRSTGEVGTFEGAFKDAAMIKVNGRIHYAAINDLEIWEGKEQEFQYEDPLEREDVREEFNSTLDLHLEKLPDFAASKWPHPLDYQLLKCKQFVERAIQVEAQVLTIIHGIGEGVLKSAVLDLLEDFIEVETSEEIQGGGALRVILTYGIGS